MKLKLYFLSAILLSLFSQSTIAQQRQRLVFHSNGLVSFASFDNRYNPHGYNILQVSFYYDERLNIDSWWRSQKGLMKVATQDGYRIDMTNLHIPANRNGRVLCEFDINNVIDEAFLYIYIEDMLGVGFTLNDLRPTARFVREFTSQGSTPRWAGA